jgi:uncharacterized protein YkuJ
MGKLLFSRSLLSMYQKTHFNLLKNSQKIFAADPDSMCSHKFSRKNNIFYLCKNDKKKMSHEGFILAPEIIFSTEPTKI